MHQASLIAEPEMSSRKNRRLTRILTYINKRSEDIQSPFSPCKPDVFLTCCCIRCIDFSAQNKNIFQVPGAAKLRLHKTPYVPV